MRACVLVVALAFAPWPAQAQLALPGAVAPTAEGEVLAPPKPQAAARGKSSSGAMTISRPKPPAESAVLGQTLSLNGTRGALQIERNGADLRAVRLALAGAKVSRPNQACEVVMGEDAPIALKPLGSPDGASRFELQSSACPILLDLLGGAVRVSTPFGACVFLQADCRADVAGVWGPPGASFSESQIKTFERERAGLEKSVQARFRALLGRAKKDPELATTLVKEQADFAAARARTCRDYEREETHGFCALRLTEARDLSLNLRLAETPEPKDSKGKAEAKTEAVAKKRVAPRPAAASPMDTPPPQPGLY